MVLGLKRYNNMILMTETDVSTCFMNVIWLKSSSFTFRKSLCVIIVIEVLTI